MTALFKKDYKSVGGYTFKGGCLYPCRETFNERYIITKDDGYEVVISKETFEDCCLLIASVGEINIDTFSWNINSTARVVARLIKNMKTEEAITEVLQAYKALEY